MRDLVLQMGISIDGYVSGGPEEDIGGGEAEHPDVVARKLAWVSQAGLHAMGRVTYEGMSGFWPTSTGVYAKPMNEIPKVVFSKTLDRVDWPPTTIASGDLEEEVATLKAEPGGDIIAYGGYTFAQALTRATWWMSTGWSPARSRSAAVSRCSRTLPWGCGLSWPRLPPTPTGPSSRSTTGA